MSRYGMAIDLDRCIGCYNCQVACKDEHCGNDFPPVAKSQPTFGQFWMSLKEQERVLSPSRIRVYYYPHLCNHCDDAPCVKASKNGAAYKRADGIVIIDPVKAEGQKELVESCPYGAIYWNEAAQLPQKCTFCAHLLDDGWDTPRCVQTCPTDCLIFGDLDDPGSRIAKFVAERGPGVLYPEHKTSPRVSYAGLPQPVVTGTLVQADNEEAAGGATVSLTGPSGKSLQATTDVYGEFCLNGIEPGSCRLTISHAGYRAQEQNLEVGADVTMLGDILLQKQ